MTLLRYFSNYFIHFKAKSMIEKKICVSIHTFAVQDNFAYCLFLVTDLLVLGCFVKALHLAFKIRTLLLL